ncbi:hypothetical protein J4I02_13690 [Paenibacillus polymyxa]|nr:hypothetical protein [Paenibacillus polymyxa]WDM20138.1 hypothetical protein J4I02_13690 [Paenibacillus polymyxa]
MSAIKKFKLTLNVKYVLDALKVLENEVTTLGCTSSSKLLALQSDESNFYIVLPCRVAGQGPIEEKQEGFALHVMVQF